MKNAFFRLALNRAYAVLGNRGRMVALAFQLVTKVRSANLSKDFLKERIFLIGRLLKAFATGKYKSIPARSILLITAAVIYFINPLDLIPDAIVAFGLTDDIAILTGVLNLVGDELEKFSHWENTNGIQDLANQH